MKTILLVATFFLSALTAYSQAPIKASVTKEPPCTGETVMGIFLENGDLTIAKNCKYDTALPDGTTHKLWKDVFGVKDGKIVLIKTVAGRVVPAKVEWIEK